MAELYSKIRKVFCSILGSLFGMLGGVFIGLSIGFNASGQMIAVLSYLLGMSIGCSLGFLFAVCWERRVKLKIGMFVVGATIGTAFALIVFWIILKLGKNPLIAFWAAFVVVNITIPILGMTFERVSNQRLHRIADKSGSR
jgi:hypothetical protein